MQFFTRLDQAELVCIKEGEESRDFCSLVGDCSCYTSLLKGENWLCGSICEHIGVTVLLTGLSTLATIQTESGSSASTLHQREIVLGQSGSKLL